MRSKSSLSKWLMMFESVVTEADETSLSNARELMRTLSETSESDEVEDTAGVSRLAESVPALSGRTPWPWDKPEEWAEGLTKVADCCVRFCGR